MKSIKHRLLSLLLTLVTVLSLLPTAAFAASNTGSGLKITTNQAYWSTRLLANGTPYSYRPPLVDGKLVYCMDSGLGYHYATPSYLNSFTWTSGTGADADAVLQSALTNSGLSEMDAATVENVKWMMTYLTDCKESNVGQLFMAVQTYVWENQSYKGEPGGDGDAGGYANADTYDLYLSLIDWLLEQKSQEDAEFQRQIEEYTAQGKSCLLYTSDAADDLAVKIDAETCTGKTGCGSTGSFLQHDFARASRRCRFFSAASGLILSDQFAETIIIEE